MKLIIDIPEIIVNNIKHYGTFLNPEDKEALQRAFRNSKPLDNSEINEVLQIIDKYRAEGEVGDGNK